MKTAIALCCVCAIIAAVSADMCHYDCYAVTPPPAGADAKTALLQACGVADYKVETNTNALASVYKKPIPNGCTVAACGRYPNEGAIDTYRFSCEHPKPQYAVLNNKGLDRYDAPCTTCAPS